MIHNLFSFHGADHKIGTTMTAQAVAEIISNSSPNLKILLVAMNGRESTEYSREAPISIDSMKFHIDNKMVSGSDFLKTCTHKGNFYIMSGITHEAEARFYHPEMAQYLMEQVAGEFDLVIADCGNDLDNGLSAGTLTVSEEVFLVLTQQESIIRRYEKNRKVFDELGIGISFFIINKYYDQDPYGLSYLANRIGAEKDKMFKINAGDYSRQAEIDYRTLLDYKNEVYILDITAVANHILNKTGFAEVQPKRKRRWKNFI